MGSWLGVGFDEENHIVGSSVFALQVEYDKPILEKFFSSTTGLYEGKSAPQTFPHLIFRFVLE